MSYEEVSTMSGVIILESPNDWIKWKRQTLNALQRAGYRSLLDRQKDPPEQGDRTVIDHEDRLEAWEDKQDKACGALKTKLGVDPQALLEDIKPPRLHLYLERLESNLIPSGTNAFQSLWTRLLLVKRVDCKDLADYVREIRSLRTELQVLHESCRLPEPFFVSLFLRGLGDEYLSFVNSFFQTRSLIPEKEVGERPAVKAVSFEEAVRGAQTAEPLLQEVQNSELQVRRRHDDTQMSFVANTSGNGETRQKDEKWCSHCKAWYHTAAECFVLHPHLKDAKSGRKNVNKKRKATNTRNEENIPPSGFLGTLGRSGFVSGLTAVQNVTSPALIHQVLEREFALDTGCNQHCVSQRRFFTNMGPYSGPPVNGIGAKQIAVEAVGTLNIPCNSNGRRISFTLENALYCPTLGANLISAALSPWTRAPFCLLLVPRLIINL
jgi:hypothetical protein